MDKKELQAAAEFGIPVVENEIVYHHIEAIYVRYKHPERVGCVRTLGVVLADSCGRSITVTKPEKVHPADEEAFRRMYEEYEKKRKGADQ